MGLPQHWLQDDVRAGMERLATKARERGVDLAIHTHVNHAALGHAAGRRGRPRDARGRRPRRAQPGRADARRQRRPPRDLLDLCFALLDGAGILPYYFYMCDMIPFAEHWRVVGAARPSSCSTAIMGYLPGLRHAAHRLRRAVRRQALGAPARGLRPRARHLVLDQELPHLHRAGRRRGADRRYEYYDPIDTLPAEGQEWWREHGAQVDHDAVAEQAAASRATAAAQAAGA